MHKRMGMSKIWNAVFEQLELAKCGRWKKTNMVRRTWKHVSCKDCLKEKKK